VKAIRVHEVGPPEVMRLEELPTPEPGAGQALVRVEATGVNFLEVYRRSGQYPGPLPFTPGMEGAGVIAKLAEGGSGFKLGDRVAWAASEGSYATHALVTVEQLVPIPDGVGTRDAAGILLQGMTAHYLSHSTYPIEAGSVALVHAGAGGVGRLLVQMLKLQGARVLATVGSEEKAAVTRQAGADEAILYTQQDFAAEARRLTGGRGVDVVYDGVGQDTFEGSLASLRSRGWLVAYGQSSGPVGPIESRRLMEGGSLHYTRVSLVHYTATRQELLERAGIVFEWLGSGKIELRVEKTYPLAEAAQAHDDLVSRRYAGKLLLIS